MDALKEAEEKSLAAALNVVSDELKTLKNNEKFAEAMEKLAGLRVPLDLFFDKIMVNCADKTLRGERLRLLARIREVMNNIANFSAIEG